MSHTLSKSRLCVYIRDGCVKILLGWITNWPGGRRGGVSAFTSSSPLLSSPHSFNIELQHMQSSVPTRTLDPPEPRSQSQRVSTDSTLERGRKLERSALLQQHLTMVIQHRNRSGLQEFKTRSISNDHIADKAVVLPRRQMLIKRFLESAVNRGGFSPG